MHEHCAAINHIAWLRYSRPPLYSLQVAQYTATVCPPLRPTVCLHSDHSVTRLCFGAACRVECLTVRKGVLFGVELDGTQSTHWAAQGLTIGPLTRNCEKSRLKYAPDIGLTSPRSLWNGACCSETLTSLFTLTTIYFFCWLWTTGTKSGHISDVRHKSWARCCQNVHNRPVLPWQYMQPISAL